MLLFWAFGVSLAQTSRFDALRSDKRGPVAGRPGKRRWSAAGASCCLRPHLSRDLVEAADAGAFAFAYHAADGGEASVLRQRVHHDRVLIGSPIGGAAGDRDASRFLSGFNDRDNAA